MPLEHLASDDPRLEPYRHLQKHNLTRWSGRFIVEGPTLVERLAAAEWPVESVLVDAARMHRVPPALVERATVYVVEAGALSEIAGFKFHRGVLACARRKASPGIESLALPQGESTTWAVCIGIVDPENLGGILRNASGLGAAGVLIGPGCADPFSRRVVRVSVGTIFRLPLWELPTDAELAAALDYMQTQNAELIAAALTPRAEPLAQSHRPQHAALLFGNEGYGLDAEWLKRCKRHVVIPMSRETDSLNVASAAAVVLYHFSQKTLS